MWEFPSSKKCLPPQNDFVEAGFFRGGTAPTPNEFGMALPPLHATDLSLAFRKAPFFHGGLSMAMLDGTRFFDCMQHNLSRDWFFAGPGNYS